MGRSDPHIFNFYNRNIEPREPTALLGFSNNNLFEGDLYDLSLENWEINSDWHLKKKYNTINCTRCAYFCKAPHSFIKKCHDHLEDEGRLFVDWGLGAHWGEFYDSFKVGWLKDGEHEWEYGENNFLWSCVWSDEFTKNPDAQKFTNNIKKFGYKDLKAAVFDEVPHVLELEYIKKYFNVEYKILSLWEDLPQLYILAIGIKK